jgi:DNA end-binding protein Ku
MWKGVLRIDAESLPVKLYSAVEDRRIHFRLLHAKDRVPVKQRLVHPATGDTISSDELVRAVEVEPGVFVAVDESETERAAPEPSRDIDISRFVPHSALDHRWYERPYYLGPDEGDPSRYFALAEALERSGREGIAHWSMRKREYVGSLRAREGYLALIALRFAEEVLPIEELDAPAGRAIDERERKLAVQLIETLSGQFDPAEFRDEYRERVEQLVEQKLKGKGVTLKRFKAKPVRDDSLVAALQKSLRRAA